jgi:hypothetical protein
MLALTTYANDLAYKSQIALRDGDRTTAFRLAAGAMLFALGHIICVGFADKRSTPTIRDGNEISVSIMGIILVIAKL